MFKNIMKQAQQAQETLKKVQEELAKVEVIGESGAGLVKITMNCDGEALDLQVDDSIEDKQIMLDLIKSAINDAKIKRDRAKNKKMQEAMSDLGLPAGFNFPFTQN